MVVTLVLNTDRGETLSVDMSGWGKQKMVRIQRRGAKTEAGGFAASASLVDLERFGAALQAIARVAREQAGEEHYE